MLKYLILISLLAFSFLGCEKIEKEPEKAKGFKLTSNEGFYTLDRIPPKVLRRFNLDRSDVKKDWETVGAFTYTTKKSYSNKEANTAHLRTCTLQEERQWNKEFCEEIKPCLNVDKCEITRTAHCGGVILKGGYFVTAKHCTGDNLDVPFHAKFMRKGKIVKYKLETTKYSLHDLPHDISIFRIPNYKGPTASIAMYNSLDAETVKAIGFPYVLFRDPVFTKYTSPWGSKRVSLGQVVNANPYRKSYCGFSNNVSEAVPESWVLEPYCENNLPQKVSDTLTLREERDPILTNTDMIFGMSGSGLFNAKGDLIGIGTTVLNSAPGNYSNYNPAVYVKAFYAQAMIDSLDCEDCKFLPPPYYDKKAYQDLVERRLWYAKNRPSYFYKAIQSLRFKDGDTISIKDFKSKDEIKFVKEDSKDWLVKIQAKRGGLFVQCKACGDFFKPFNLLEKTNWVSPMGFVVSGYKGTDEYAVYLKDPERDTSVIKKELSFYKFNKNAIVRAEIVRNQKKEKKTFDTSAEREKVLYSYGKLKFKWGKEDVEMPVYTWDPPEKPTRGLMLVFRDKTNGKATYKGGRYLDFTHPNIDKMKYITVDFNQTYHPNCAYTPFYNCILPNDPKLKVAINAGERYK